MPTLVRTRGELRELADIRLIDARLLLEQARFSGAAYLAGYAIECLLKACFAARTAADALPERPGYDSLYTHNLGRLLVLAGLDKALRQEDAELREHWALVSRWSEQWRYDPMPLGDARITPTQMLAAIDHPISGIRRWLLAYC
jgi:hypothetical protein